MGPHLYFYRAFDETEKTLGSVLDKARFWETHGQKSFNERQRLMLNILLDVFEGNLNSFKCATIAKCSNDTALRDILDLVERGVLAKDQGAGAAPAIRCGRMSTPINTFQLTPRLPQDAPRRRSMMQVRPPLRVMHEPREKITKPKTDCPWDFRHTRSKVDKKVRL